MTMATPVRQPLNLQLFADSGGEERQHPATPRRRQQARQRGQVFRSIELSSALILAGGLGALQLFGSFSVRQVYALFNQSLAAWPQLALTPEQALTLMGTVATSFILAVAPVLALLLAVGLAVNVAQVGFVWSTTPLQPQFKRINPLEGAKRIFSRRALFDFGKSLAKVTIIAGITYLAFRRATDDLIMYAGEEVHVLVRIVGRHAVTMFWQAALALIGLAALDFMYQRYEYERNLMMTRKEVKEELRDAEGDPQLRSRIRRRQREMAQARMLQDVARADVVITNPTHYAVALRYDPQSMDAPICCAKGKGHLALTIRELARKHDVTWVEDRYLARSLFAAVEVGQPVPTALYEAVAEVLAFVWRLRNRAWGDLS